MPAVFSSLDWDSAQLGFPCGKIVLSPEASAFDPDRLAETICDIWRQQAAVRLILLKFSASLTGLLARLNHPAAKVIETELVFQRKGGDNERPLPPATRLLFLDRTDPEPFLRLAPIMRHSRYFLDPGIPTTVAKRLWEESIVNHCTGLADGVVVAEVDGRPAGLATLSFSPPGQLSLHIVGVLPEYQGRGLGAALAAAAARRHGDATVSIAALSGNGGAGGAYQKAGYKVSSAQHVIHLWNAAGGA